VHRHGPAGEPEDQAAVGQPDGVIPAGAEQCQLAPRELGELAGDQPPRQLLADHHLSGPLHGLPGPAAAWMLAGGELDHKSQS
jgi:hypothetical protein